MSLDIHACMHTYIHTHTHVTAVKGQGTHWLSYVVTAKDFRNQGLAKRCVHPRAVTHGLSLSLGQALSHSLSLSLRKAFSRSLSLGQALSHSLSLSLTKAFSRSLRLGTSPESQPQSESMRGSRGSA